MELKRVAYHEAGHATMTVLTRRQLYYVTIKPGPKGKLLGHCAWFKSLVWDQDYRSPSSDYRKEIQRILAGPIAERIGMSDEVVGHHCNTDIQLASVLSVIMAVCPVIAELEFNDIRDEVEQTLINKWQVVEGIANALLEQETLKGRQVRQLVKDLSGTVVRRSIGGTP